MQLLFVLQSSGFHQLPIELTDKQSFYTWQAVFGVVVCMALIALSRMNSSGIFFRLLNGNFKLVGIRTLHKESLSLSKFPSLLLLFNFILITSILLFKFSEGNLVSPLLAQLILISPIILFLWDNLGYLFATVISGEGAILTEVRLIRLYGAQFLGLILWLLVVFHVLYPTFRLEIELAMCYIILTEFVLRTLRSIILVYSSGAVWYYIILYFCTLEILPLFIAFSIFVGVS